MSGGGRRFCGIGLDFAELSLLEEVGTGGGGAVGLQIGFKRLLRRAVMQLSDGVLEQTESALFSYPLGFGEGALSEAGRGDIARRIGADIWSGERDLAGDRSLLGFLTASGVFSTGMFSSHFWMLCCLVSVVAAQLWQAAKDGNSGSFPLSDLKSCGSQPGQPEHERLRLFSRLRLMTLLLRPIGRGWFEVGSTEYEASSSGMPKRLGENFFVAIFCLAIVMTSRIFVRNSMAAGGGAWKNYLVR